MNGKRTKHLTYRDLQKMIEENPQLLDKDVIVYQTDNFTRKLCGVQTGCGGDFLKATRDWD